MINRLFRQMLATQIVSAMTVVLCMLIDSIMIGRFLGVDSMSAYGLASPLLLVADNNKTNREQTQANINELVAPFTKDMTKGYIFGGKGAVSLQIEEWLNEAVE